MNYMKEMLRKTLILSMLSCFSCSEYSRVCYYESHAESHNTQPHHDIGLCSHVIYGFGSVQKRLDMQTGSFDLIANFDRQQIHDLKAKYGQLKILIGIHKHMQFPNDLLEATSSFESRNIFAEQVLHYLILHDLDGVSLHWEYSGEKPKAVFTLLCKELRRVLKDIFILVATVSGTPEIAEISYNPSEIDKYLDFFNIISYDFPTNLDFETKHPNDFELTLKSVNYWISKGIASKKLMLGLSAFGKAYQLSDQCNNLLGAVTKDFGFLIAYNRLCTKTFESMVCTKSSKAKAPYGYDGKLWIAFDDEESITLKIQKILKPKHLGGFMFWAMNLDDFDNVCPHGSSLLKAANRALVNDIKYIVNKCQDFVNSACPSTTNAPINLLNHKSTKTKSKHNVLSTTKLTKILKSTSTTKATKSTQTTKSTATKPTTKTTTTKPTTKTTKSTKSTIKSTSNKRSTTTTKISLPEMNGSPLQFDPMLSESVTVICYPHDNDLTITTSNRNIQL